MTRPVNRRRGLLVVAAVVLLVLGAVGGYAWAARSPASGDAADASAVTVGAVSHRASATGHNGADVEFARSMTPHHTQAIEMARLARTRAGSAQVRTLASTIEAAQGPEIRQMAGWLAAWGSAGDHGGAVAGTKTGTMPGTMSRADMSALAAKRGAAFDRDFVTMMIGHHTGAVAMARDELVRGRNASALGLATSVQVTQQAEVDQMRTMLRRLR